MMTMTIDAMQVREPTATLLRDPASAHAECADMAQLAQEAFAVLTLNTKNKLIARHLVSLGLVNSAPVHPREVFRPAISDGAEAVILAHNHPSGDPTPSAEDLRVTRQLIEAGKVIGIRVLDHVIIGRGETPHLPPPAARCPSAFSLQPSALPNQPPSPAFSVAATGVP